MRCAPARDEPTQKRLGMRIIDTAAGGRAFAESHSRRSGDDERNLVLAVLDSGHGGGQELVKVGCAKAGGGVPALGGGKAVRHLAALFVERRG